MTAQRADGNYDGADADEERLALARLLGGPPPARTPESSPPPPAAPSPAARFELRAARAPGLFGARFLALDRARGEEQVWVERLEGREGADAGFPARFAALSAELAGLPGLLPWLGTELDGRGRRLVAQPAYEGESVRELLSRRGTLPPAHALEIVRQVLRALEPAHARGLAHGSLAPEHVRLRGRVAWSEENPFGVGVELAAFGLAGLLGSPSSLHDDLQQVWRLLAELVTGQAESEEAVDALPRAVRGPLRRARSAASAGELRAAFEAACTSARPRRAFSRGFLVGSLALALLATFVAWRTQRTLARERAAGASADRAQEAAREDERARAALERFLEFLEEGADDEAARVLAATRAEASLAERGFATGFLEAALAASAALARGEEVKALERAEALLVARDALAEAFERREPFLLASSVWAAQPGPSRAAPRSELLRWFDGLEQALAPRSATLARELERELERGEHLAPRAALVLARWRPEFAARVEARARPEDGVGLRLALAADPPALFGRTGERFLWRVERPDGTLAWREDRVVARHVSGARLERRLSRQEVSGPPVQVHFGWRGTSLVLDPPLEAPLDLAGVLRASHFVPRPADSGPPETSSAAAAALRAALAAGSPAECASGDGRAWLFPGLGLVRRVLEDGTVLELVWRGVP